VSADHLVAWATFLLVAATVLLVWVTLRGIREQLWLLTFSEYTRRYAEIVDMLPPDARRPGATFDFAALSPPERDRILTAMRRYLNLCSEERFLHSRGKIDATTWSIWRTGIRDTARLPCFQAAWTMLRSEYEYYTDFQAFMDELVRESASGDAVRRAL
jgi:hypothetical protein